MGFILDSSKKLNDENEIYQVETRMIQWMMAI